MLKYPEKVNKYNYQFDYIKHIAKNQIFSAFQSLFPA